MSCIHQPSYGSILQQTWLVLSWRNTIAEIARLNVSVKPNGATVWLVIWMLLAAGLDQSWNIYRLTSSKTRLEGVCKVNIILFIKSPNCCLKPALPQWWVMANYSGGNSSWLYRNHRHILYNSCEIIGIPVLFDQFYTYVTICFDRLAIRNFVFPLMTCMDSGLLLTAHHYIQKQSNQRR